MELPDGGTYTLTVTSEIPGYEPADGDGDAARRRRRRRRPASPTTPAPHPGTSSTSAAVRTRSSPASLPAGWEIIDNERQRRRCGRSTIPAAAATSPVVTAASPSSTATSTARTGRQDTSLVTPPVDLTGVDRSGDPFQHRLQRPRQRAGRRRPQHRRRGDVDERVAAADRPAGPAGRRDRHSDGRQRPPTCKVRFHYHVGTFDWWWQVDEVFVGSAAAGVACARRAGWSGVGQRPRPDHRRPVSTTPP